MYKITAALFLAACMLLSACSSSQVSGDIQTSETTSKKAGIGEAAPLYDPVDEKIVFSDPAVGGNAILSQDTLDGYTARLELINIKSLPEDENGAYTAEQAHVRAILPDGGELILELNNMVRGEGVWADCTENALKIFAAGDKGRRRYILMIHEVYVKSKGIYKADFYDITAGTENIGRHSVIGIDNDYTSPLWLSVSDRFAHKEGAVFTDSELGYELTFDFEYFEANCTTLEGYSYEPVFAEPEIGGDAVFSEVTAGDLTARLELKEIITLPAEERKVYEAVRGVGFVLTDENGNEAHTVLNIGELAGQYSGGVWADCTENAVKLYEIESNGEKKYVLRGYISYGTENGAYPNNDPDLYHARFYVCDFDAAEGGVLRPYSIGGSWNGDFSISDSLMYKGGNVLYDEKQQIELIIDPDSYTITTVYLTEE